MISPVLINVRVHVMMRSIFSISPSFTYQILGTREVCNYMVSVVLHLFLIKTTGDIAEEAFKLSIDWWLPVAPLQVEVRNRGVCLL